MPLKSRLNLNKNFISVFELDIGLTNDVLALVKYVRATGYLCCPSRRIT